MAMFDTIAGLSRQPTRATGAAISSICGKRPLIVRHMSVCCNQLMEKLVDKGIYFFNFALKILRMYTYDSISVQSHGNV